MSKQQIEEASDLIRHLMNFAYEQGFHECGYDPLAVLLSAYDRLAQENATLLARLDCNNEMWRTEATSCRAEITRLQQQIAEQLPSALKEKLRSAEDRIAQLESDKAKLTQLYNDNATRSLMFFEETEHLKTKIAEMQPREVDADILERQFAVMRKWDAFFAFNNEDLRRAIPSLCQPLLEELARWNGTHAGRMCEMERINKDREELRGENVRLREALQAYVENDDCDGGDHVDEWCPCVIQNRKAQAALAAQTKTEGK